MVQIPEEWKKWRALDKESQDVDSAKSFEDFVYKLCETLEDSPKVNKDFTAMDFMANVHFKFHDINQAFSKSEQKDEMFKRCMKWFALVMSDAASAGNLLRRIDNKEI